MLRVERAPDSSEVEVGGVFEVEDDELIIGRASDVRLRFQDPSVSLYHVTLRASERGFVVHNSSERGSTWVGGQALKPGEEVQIEEIAWLQLGHILLHVSLAAHTLPVETAYSLPPSPGRFVSTTASAFLEVDAGLYPKVHVMGHEQPLFPMALRLLWRLCDSAGEVVTHQQLKEALSPDPTSGGINVPQNITYVRDMFEEALEVGEITEEDLRRALEASLGSARIENMVRRELLRALVQSVRGRGYRLNLTSDQISLKD